MAGQEEQEVSSVGLLTLEPDPVLKPTWTLNAERWTRSESDDRGRTREGPELAGTAVGS